MATVPNDIEVCVSETPCPSLKTAPTSDISKLLPFSAFRFGPSDVIEDAKANIGTQ